MEDSDKYVQYPVEERRIHWTLPIWTSCHFREKAVFVEHLLPLPTGFRGAFRLSKTVDEGRTISSRCQEFFLVDIGVIFLRGGCH